MADDSNYKTGYGKPPRDSQFKMGQSGNPKGRPKGTRNVRTMFEDVMLEEVAYTDKGKKRCRQALELILLQLRQSAIKGDTKATEMILRYFQQFGMSRPEPEPIGGLLDEDKAILEDFAEQAITATRPPDEPTGQGGAK